MPVHIYYYDVMKCFMNFTSKMKLTQTNWNHLFILHHCFIQHFCNITQNSIFS